ncbi:MAG: precorrin-6A reductase [Clostridiales bacterium]|jgi:precorrin-6x reductase|nr:precorrin-6A reductase [Clostridiales bacterium]
MIIVFGGTSEGRKLCEELRGQDVLLCVATDYGKTDGVHVRVGRLDVSGMVELFKTEQPQKVIDATHPYALEVSANIKAACEHTGVEYQRVAREITSKDGYLSFGDLDEMINAANERDGVIFSALGAKEAAKLTNITGYQSRVWLRILPDVSSLKACIDLGFPARRIICMQGPFSAELNAAMFKAAEAKILLTKNSGAAGGFEEKLQAAKICGIEVVLVFEKC